MEFTRANARSISFKKESNKTSIKHNNRDFEQEEWNKKYHEHINSELTKNNQYLIQKDIHDVYDDLFGEAVEEYNAKQKRKDRKIDNYFNHVRDSKTLNLQQEFIIQIGDINNYVSDEFKDNLPRDDKGNVDYKKLSSCETDTVKENKRIANEILKEYVKGFEERNPNLKIYNAAIHNDEVSPHLHINVVPVATGYKKGVNVRPSFNKALEQQNLSGDTPLDIFKSFRQQELSAIEEIMRDYDLERKRVGTNEIKDIHEYKEVMSEVSKAKEQVRETERELDKTEREIDKLETVKETVTGQLKSMLNLKKTLEEKGEWKTYTDEMKIEKAKEFFPNPLNKADKLEKAEMILELKDRASVTDSVIFASNKFLNTSSINILDEIQNGVDERLEPLEKENEKLKKENKELKQKNKELDEKCKSLDEYNQSLLKLWMKNIVKNNTLVYTVKEVLKHTSEQIQDFFYKNLGERMAKEEIDLKDNPMRDNIDSKYHEELLVTSYDVKKRDQLKMKQEREREKRQSKNIYRGPELDL